MRRTALPRRSRHGKDERCLNDKDADTVRRNRARANVAKSGNMLQGLRRDPVGRVVVGPLAQ